MDDQTKGIGSERSAGRSDEYISGREALDTDGRTGERATSRIPSRTPAGGPGSGDYPDTTRNLSASSSTDAPTEERTREIRAEIAHTRGEMSETVNAIQERLSPGNIASNAAGSVKETIKHVAEDKAQMIAERARDVADSEPVQYVRANPIPTAMIGIGIAGLTWLAFGGREARSYDRFRRDRYSRDWRPLTPYDESGRYYRGSAARPRSTDQADPAESSFGDAGFGEVGYPGQGGYETAAAYASELEHGRRGEYVRYRGEHGRGSRSDYYGSRNARDLGARVQQTSRDAQRTLQRAWQENPLLLGAASAVLGLMVGMAVPQSEIENEYMGEARDSALEGVQQTVRDTVNKVQDAAGTVVDLVSGDQKASGRQGPGQPVSQGPGQSPGGPGQPPKNPGIA
jgi:hypothetical protein